MLYLLLPTFNTLGKNITSPQNVSIILNTKISTLCIFYLTFIKKTYILVIIDNVGAWRGYVICWKLSSFGIASN